MSLDTDVVVERVGHLWDDEIVAALHDYIAIPNVSPAYDAQWASAGHMDAAVALVRAWCVERPIPGLTVEVHELAGRTPLLVMEIPARDADDGDDTVVLYGHLDKQPEMTGWRDGLGPWTPVLEGERLYGRGGAATATRRSPRWPPSKRCTPPAGPTPG